MSVSQATPHSEVLAHSARRLQMLAALDIDVWQLRTSEVQDTGTSAEPETKRGVKPGAGPAGARAVLDDLAGAPAPAAVQTAVSTVPASSSPASSTPATSAAKTASSGSVEAANPEPNTPQPPESSGPKLDLWCLSGPHGVLLADHIGLGPHAQRLLNDVFQSAMRLVMARHSEPGDAGAPAKLKIRQLRFSWPPADESSQLKVAAPTFAALRGFLSRQLQDKPTPVVLVAGATLAELLAGVELNLPAERLVSIAEVDTLLSDGAAKRALWQTLKTL